MTSLHVRPRQTLYRDPTTFSAFPSIACLGDGTLLLSFRRAPDHRRLLKPSARDAAVDSVDHLHPKSHIALRRLGPDLTPLGEIWAMPQHPAAADQDTSLIRCRNGRIVHLGFLWLPVTEEREQLQPPLNGMAQGSGPAYLAWHAYARTSDDDGASWSDYRPFPPDPLLRPDLDGLVPGTAAIRGQAVETADARLLCAAYAGHLVAPVTRGLRLYESGDGGNRWRPVGALIAHSEARLSETSLVAWPAGRISLFARTARADDRIAYAVSDDGISFTEPRLLPIRGHPTAAHPLTDGRLLLVYGYRHAPYGVRARILRPDRPFDHSREEIIVADAPGPDTGYPWVAPVGAGRVAVVYYRADADGIRGIDGSLIDID